MLKNKNERRKSHQSVTCKVKGGNFKSLVFARYTEHLIQALGVTVIGEGKVKFTLEKSMKAQSGSIGIVLLFL
jgi:5-enolpyruvylshikimate-3-phosphate synthase